MDARVRSGWFCPYAAVSSRWMPRVVGRRQEARDPCSWQDHKQEPPAASETAAEHPRAQLAARQADRRRYGATWVHAHQAGIT